MCFYSKRDADSIKFHAKHTFLVHTILGCHGNLTGGDLVITKFTPQTAKLASFGLKSFISIAFQYTLAWICSVSNILKNWQPCVCGFLLNWFATKSTYFSSPAESPTMVVSQQTPPVTHTLFSKLNSMNLLENLQAGTKVHPLSSMSRITAQATAIHHI